MGVNVTSTTEKLTIDGKKVDSFTYLGNIVTNDGGSEEDVRVWIRKANGAFIQLYPIWKSKNFQENKNPYIQLTHSLMELSPS
jgi:hypothetical protein